jgi:hypothetical protein
MLPLYIRYPTLRACYAVSINFASLSADTPLHEVYYVDEYDLADLEGQFMNDVGCFLVSPALSQTSSILSLVGNPQASLDSALTHPEEYLLSLADTQSLELKVAILACFILSKDPSCVIVPPLNAA